MGKKLTLILGDIDQKMVNILPEDKCKKYKKYRNEFNRASNFIERYDNPIHVDFELSNLCNYSCSFWYRE